MNDNNYQKRIEKRFELLKLAKCLYQDKEGLCNLKSNIRRLNPSCHEELERTDNSTDFFRVLEKYKIFTIDMTVKQIEELIEVLKIFGEEKHIREINKWKIVMVSHSTSKQILMFADRLKQIEKSFQDILHENLVIERGASSSSVMTISEFISSECKEYMERYFSGMDYFVFNDDETFQLLKGFKTHLQKNKPAFLVRNYDLYNHFKFLQLHHLLTQSEMTVMDYMGFEAKNKFIYFIKLSNAKTLIELIRDVNTSATYLRMFALLHQNSLLSTGIHLVSVIVISDEFEKLKDEVSKNCQFCPKYIFTEKEFSKFSIGLFLKLKGNIKEDSICQTAFNFEDFKCAMGSLFCYMATKSGNLMPNLSNKCSTQIEQAIILYPQQVAVSNSSNKRVIIQGGSGSGKTIIGRLRLKELSSDPNNKVIYYINCGTSQGFTEEMKSFVDATNQNSNVHCCSKSEFKTNSVTEMLQLIEEKHKDVEIVHVILEEVPLDELNENEILSVIELLKNSKFKDGHFKIICQTMLKERSVLRNGVEVSRTSSNQIDLLQSEADFELAILSKSARNTVAIFKLVNIAIEMLEMESNSFTLVPFEVETFARQQSSPSNDDIAKKEIEMTSENDSMASDHPSELLDDDQNVDVSNSFPLVPFEVETVVKQQNSPTKDDKAKKESEVASKNDTIGSYHHSELLDNDQNVDVSAKKQDTDMSNIPDNLDAKFKYIDKQSQDAIKNRVLDTIFRFKKNDGSFHKIEGPKPVLFFPFADGHYNDKDKICLLTACFHQVFIKSYIPFEEHVTIIHLENKSPSLLLSSLMCLEENEISPNYDIKRSLDVNGLEFDNAIIYIDIGEYHMRHYFLEAISRCKSNLVIIAVKEDIKNVHGNVISKIFERYEADNLVTVFKSDDLKDVSKDLQNKYQDYFNELKEENQIKDTSVMLSIEQFAASLNLRQQFQHENKEDRTHGPTMVDEVDLKVEIAKRIKDWRSLGRALGISEDIMSMIDPDYSTVYEKCLKVWKYHIDSKKLDFEPDWSYWKYRLCHFNDGRNVIQEIELEIKKSILDAVEESLEAIDNADLKVTIARRIKDWRSLGRKLNICEDIMSRINTNSGSAYEKCLKVLKYHVDSEKPDPEPDWSYWKYCLHRLENGENVIQEIELMLQKYSIMGDDYHRNIYLFLDYVSRRIPTVWEELGRFLYVQDAAIDAIKIDNVTVNAKARAMLCCVKNSPNGLKWEDLKAGLLHYNRGETVRDIEASQIFRTLAANAIPDVLLVN